MIFCELFDIIGNYKRIGFKVQEGEFTLDKLMEAQGVFITNSIMGIMKINKIGDKIINESVIVSQLKRYYDRYIENYKV